MDDLLEKITQSRSPSQAVWMGLEFTRFSLRMRSFTLGNRTAVSEHELKGIWQTLKKSFRMSLLFASTEKLRSTEQKIVAYHKVKTQIQSASRF
jgi:hypothetical protein